MADRRTLLRGLATLPLAGLVPATALANPSPDAALFRLLDRYGPARASASAAGDRSDTLWATFLEQEPERPSALHYSGADVLGCGFDVEVRPNGRRIALYGLVEVEKLQRMPLPTLSRWVGAPAPWGNSEEVGHWVQVPDERAIARRAEIIAAHDAWWAECMALRDSLGVTAADEAEENASAAFHEVESAILAMLPATAAGLVAKARWASSPGLPSGTAAQRAERVTADMIAMAERDGRSA